mmetsp:Transcript_17645/g.53035  ORF Transcript_17645/g.53035 Transcript_17645/m.53035 type:complete len:250 (-) Transcript_17645:684-1433(-)
MQLHLQIGSGRTIAPCSKPGILPHGWCGSSLSLGPAHVHFSTSAEGSQRRPKLRSVPAARAALGHDDKFSHEADLRRQRVVSSAWPSQQSLSLHAGRARATVRSCAVVEHDADLRSDGCDGHRHASEGHHSHNSQPQHHQLAAQQHLEPGRLPSSVPADAPLERSSGLTVSTVSAAVTQLYRRAKRRLRLQPSQQYDAQILAISGPAVIALAADPLLSLIDTAFVGRLGPAQLVCFRIDCLHHACEMIT